MSTSPTRVWSVPFWELTWDLDSWLFLPSCLMPQGPRPPPAHLGIRRWPWGRLGSRSLSMCFHLCPAPQGGSTWSQVFKRQQHPRMGTSWEHVKERDLCSIYLLRNWAKFCSEKSEQSHTMEPEEVSFAGSLRLGQGLGVQLWQDPLEGEVQRAWHTLAITGAAKEALIWGWLGPS